MEAPAAVSKSIVRAIWLPISTACSCLPRTLPATLRVLDCMIWPISGRESWSAGKSPKSMPVSNASPTLNNKTGTWT